MINRLGRVIIHPSLCIISGTRFFRVIICHFGYVAVVFVKKGCEMTYHTSIVAFSLRTDSTVLERSYLLVFTSRSVLLVQPVL